jgi:sulfoxide reductase heme-binding subunit YedZ
VAVVIAAAATVGPSAFWYLTRATGAVALILLTVSLIVGIAAIGRLRSRSVPRFMVDGIHRTASLLSIVFLVVHIITAVLDTFAPISLSDAVIPFAGTYRPIWLGLGAASFDLMLAVTVTSLIRQRLGHSTWRAVHWLAYLAWPLAVVHNFGTGSDIRHTWMFAISVICILAVLVAVGVRALIGWPENVRVRIGALSLAGVFAIGLIVWLPGGPLASGWSRRAGTPRTLLGSSTRARRA